MERGRLAVKTIAIWTGKWKKAKRTGSDEDKRGIQIKVIWWKWRVLDATHIWRGGKAGTVWKEKEGARRRKKMRRHIRCWGRGRGINGLFELCKIAAWERRGVCLSISVAVWQKRLREGESKGKRMTAWSTCGVRGKIGCNAGKKNNNNERLQPVHILPVGYHAVDFFFWYNHVVKKVFFF